MILLDTNVVSEPLRMVPNPSVITWLDAQMVETLYLTTLTLAEVRYGIAALPAGRRRRTLEERFEGDVVPLFEHRILTFDEAATVTYATMRASARARGVSIGDFDALIASIARSHSLTVATRDTGPFAAVGLPVIDPFAG